MAILRKKQIQEMSDADLLKREVELRKELMKFRAKASTGVAPDNPGKIKAIKRTIARILTMKKRRGISKR